MDTQKEMYEVIGRAMADEEFRKSLKEDPKAAVERAGYQLTQEQLASLKEADLSTVAEGLDDRLSKIIILPP